ncbi:hypothetical protein JAAARDRAFT_468176, partial [Jaapia argillacea MUCL 33604]
MPPYPHASNVAFFLSGIVFVSAVKEGRRGKRLGLTGILGREDQAISFPFPCWLVSCLLHSNQCGASACALWRHLVTLFACPSLLNTADLGIFSFAVTSFDVSFWRWLSRSQSSVRAESSIGPLYSPFHSKGVGSSSLVRSQNGGTKVPLCPFAPTFHCTEAHVQGTC